MSSCSSCGGPAPTRRSAERVSRDLSCRAAESCRTRCLSLRSARTNWATLSIGCRVELWWDGNGRCTRLRAFDGSATGMAAAAEPHGHDGGSGSGGGAAAAARRWPGGCHWGTACSACHRSLASQLPRRQGRSGRPGSVVEDASSLLGRTSFRLTLLTRSGGSCVEQVADEPLGFVTVAAPPRQLFLPDKRTATARWTITKCLTTQMQRIRM